MVGAGARAGDDADLCAGAATKFRSIVAAQDLNSAMESTLGKVSSPLLEPRS